MSLYQIDREAIGEALRLLAALDDTLTTVRDRIGAAASTAGLTEEHRPTERLRSALQQQIGLLTSLIRLTDDRAGVADSRYEQMLSAWIGSVSTSIRRSLDDGRGMALSSLLAAGTIDTNGETLRMLTPAAAGSWFGSLSADERLRLVATSADVLVGTAAQPIARTWQDHLDPGDLRELFRLRALDRAGIDPTNWDPGAGLDANRETVEAVYEYYAELYRAGNDRLWWAGMAALIGPSFYGGFQDLDTFERMLGTGAAILGGPLGAVVPSAVAPNQLTGLGERALTDELTWYQERLLLMQREIFFDMAPAHEAYLDGGLAMVARLCADDPYGAGEAAVQAWTALDTGWRTGDSELIAQGNAALLRREQATVVADDYDAMRNRPTTGEAITFMMTAVGAPSVPGARTYPEVFPAVVDVSHHVGTPRNVPESALFGKRIQRISLPHVGVRGTAVVETPLPDGNIADLDDRWNLIVTDTLPVYQGLAEHRPDVVIGVLADPVGVRASRYTIRNRLDDLVDDAVTNWGVRVEFEFESDW